MLLRGTAACNYSMRKRATSLRVSSLMSNGLPSTVTATLLALPTVKRQWNAPLNSRVPGCAVSEKMTSPLLRTSVHDLPEGERDALFARSRQRRGELGEVAQVPGASVGDAVTLQPGARLPRVPSLAAPSDGAADGGDRQALPAAVASLGRVRWATGDCTYRHCARRHARKPAR